MNALAPRQSTSRLVIAGACLCALAAGIVIATTALLVVATGRAADTRHALGFGFGGVDPSLSEVAGIASHNARVAWAALACAVAAPRLPVVARRAVDVLLAVVLSLSASAVGTAYGAYGWRAISATASHLPIEFAGLSLAGGAYLHARRQAIRAHDLAVVASGCAVLLVVAALLETYVSPSGGSS